LNITQLFTARLRNGPSINCFFPSINVLVNGRISHLYRIETVIMPSKTAEDQSISSLFNFGGTFEDDLILHYCFHIILGVIQSNNTNRYTYNNSFLKYILFKKNIKIIFLFYFLKFIFHIHAPQSKPQSSGG